MQANYRARMSRLEKLRPCRTGPALVVIQGADHDQSEIVSVSGLNMPRLAHEDAAAYLARLETHTQQLRGNIAPLYVFAEYAGDE